MRQLFVPIAVGFVGLAPMAIAKIDSVQTTRSVSYSAAEFNGAAAVKNSSTQLGPGAGFTYANYQVSADVTPTQIVFGANASAQGYSANTAASTSVKIRFTNDGSAAVTPTLNSTIIPGGFGFYVANPSLGAGTDSKGAYLDINSSPQSSAHGFDDFSPLPTGGTQRLADAFFDFTISSGNSVVANYSGEVWLDYNAASPANPILGYQLQGLASTLKNFALATAVDNNGAYGFQWDATDFTVALGGLLAPGASRTLTYTTSVTAITDGAGTGSNSAEQLQTYVGFGDPIGRSGQNSRAPDPFVGILADAPTTATVKGVTFSRFGIGLPTFNSDSGSLSLPVYPDPLPNLTLTNQVAAIPEPGSWALMLLGIGGLGAALRSRACHKRRRLTPA
jgi:hypothetical protein